MLVFNKKKYIILDKFIYEEKIYSEMLGLSP